MARKKVVNGRGAGRVERKAEQHKASETPDDQPSSSSRRSPPESRKKTPSPTFTNAYLQPNDEHFISFREQLRTIGLMLRDIAGDGNCLFRALGDQLEGHGRNHMQHRMDTVRYMIQHSKDFEPFVSEEISFDRYIDRLARVGTFAGQDALVAFARLHKVVIVIHQLNSPMWMIEGGGCPGIPELHLSYHNGEHYSSVRRLDDWTQTPADVTLSHVMVGPKKVTPSASPAKTPAFLDSATEDDLDSGAEALHSATLPRPPSPVYRNLVQFIMDNSGCVDTNLAESILIDMNYDADLAVEHLLHLCLPDTPTELTAASSSKVEYDFLNSYSDAGAKPKIPPSATHKYLSNRQRKELKKKEKLEEPKPAANGLTALPNIACLSL